MPVRSWRARLAARLREAAGVSQSATVGAMVVVSLAITMGLVPFGPKIGSAVADLFICELGQSGGGRCGGDAQQAGDRRVLLDGADPAAAPAWYQPGYNSTVYTGPPPPTAAATTSGAGGDRPVDGTPTSMDWCTPPPTAR